MAGFGLLGHLAGGYAQAAEEENRRNFEAEQNQRQAALGMTKILLENPAVPPEYKGILAQYGMDVIHTPHGKKIPDFQKSVLGALPAIPGKPNPGPGTTKYDTSMTLPGTPPGIQASPLGGPLTQGAVSPSPLGGSLPNGAYGPPQPAGGPPGAMASLGPVVATSPLQIPGAVINPPAPPPAANIANAGQFHMMGPAEMGAQQGQANAAQIQAEIQSLKQQGFTDEQIGMKLGMSKLAPIPFGGLYNTSTGETIMPGNTPMTKVQYMVNGQGPFFGFTSRAGGPIMDMNNQPVPNATPFVPSAMDTVTTSPYRYFDLNGNLQTQTNVSTKHKVLPSGGQLGAVAAPAPPPGIGTTSAATGTPAGGRGTPSAAAATPRPAVSGGGGASPKLSPSLVRADKSYKDISTQLDKVQTPIDQLAARMSRLTDTLDQHNPQADALVAPELLTVMAGGQGSGLRMNEAEIARIVGGRSKWQSLQASINKWKLDPNEARSITPEQDEMIRSLVDTVRQKVDAKRGLLEQARTDLLNATTPEQHRKIYADVRSKVLAVDTATGSTDAGGGAHIIEVGGKHYQYKGSGDTADMKNYSEVPAR